MRHASLVEGRRLRVDAQRHQRRLRAHLPPPLRCRGLGMRCGRVAAAVAQQQPPRHRLARLDLADLVREPHELAMVRMRRARRHRHHEWRAHDFALAVEEVHRMRARAPTQPTRTPPPHRHCTRAGTLGLCEETCGAERRDEPGEGREGEGGGGGSGGVRPLLQRHGAVSAAPELTHGRQSRQERPIGSCSSLIRLPFLLRRPAASWCSPTPARARPPPRPS